MKKGGRKQGKRGVWKKTCWAPAQKKGQCKARPRKEKSGGEGKGKGEKMGNVAPEREIWEGPRKLFKEGWGWGEWGKKRVSGGELTKPRELFGRRGIFRGGKIENTGGKKRATPNKKKRSSNKEFKKEKAGHEVGISKQRHGKVISPHEKKDREGKRAKKWGRHRPAKGKSTRKGAFGFSRHD